MRFIGLTLHIPRRVLKDQKLLIEEIGWQIGNGTSVNIWNDVWMTGPGSGRLDFQFIDTRYTRVEHLIQTETFTWYQEIIRGLFGENQLKQILTIPLVHRDQQDTAIWRGDDLGIYTVRSAYK